MKGIDRISAPPSTMYNRDHPKLRSESFRERKTLNRHNPHERHRFFPTFHPAITRFSHLYDYTKYLFTPCCRDSQKWLTLHGHDSPEDAVAKLKEDGYQVGQSQYGSPYTPALNHLCTNIPGEDICLGCMHPCALPV